jgi:kumamolisin
MPPDEIRVERQKFLTLASRSVNVFVSSGDAGSNPDSSGHNTSPGPQQVEYESSDPFTIGVGGTSLELDRVSGAVYQEGGWIASGGGVSHIFDRPRWQTGSGVPSGTKRLVPDVSLAADPTTGAMYVYDGKMEQIGGTSWSAPVWAGICALINEARSNAGKKPLAFLPPYLYPLAGSNAFRDITKGSNGAYSAQVGYDMVTGLGVPDIKNLSDALLTK